MSGDRVNLVAPAELPEPVGYAHGAVVSGRMLFVAGQIGVDARGEPAGDFAEQFARALDNVLAVIAKAGGGAHDVAQMTVYVVDMAGYRRLRPELAGIWRARMGRHYPAMSLLGVAELFEPRALVEIEAVCALPAEGG